MSGQAVRALVGGLRRCIEGLEWTPAGTQWAEYTSDNSYTDAAARSKRDIISRAIAGLEAQIVWDLGANTGEYSRAAREAGAQVIAFDIDPAAVERNYRHVRASGESGILPLLLDLANPSRPRAGPTASDSRSSSADPRMLSWRWRWSTISPSAATFRSIGSPSFLSRLGRALIIEFVPKSDVQVQRLLRNRADVFPGYTVEGFEEAFRPVFPDR